MVVAILPEIPLTFGDVLHILGFGLMIFGFYLLVTSRKRFIKYKIGDAKLFYQMTDRIARLSSRILRHRKKVHHKGRS